MPPPPLSDFWDFIAPPFRFRGNRYLLRSAYYANSVYANTVDVNTPHLEHSKCERNRFKNAPAGLGAADKGAANRTRLFAGKFCRQMRRPPDVHGNHRARREQPELPEHRQGGDEARGPAVHAF